MACPRPHSWAVQNQGLDSVPSCFFLYHVVLQFWTSQLEIKHLSLEYLHPSSKVFGRDSIIRSSFSLHNSSLTNICDLSSAILCECVRHCTWHSAHLPDTLCVGNPGVCDARHRGLYGDLQSHGIGVGWDFEGILVQFCTRVQYSFFFF